MQHLDEGTIHAWLDGALPPEHAADVERHAQTCAECSALVADARGVIAGAARIVSALDDVPAGVIPPRQAPTSTRSLWRTLRLTPFRAALAASLMLAVASLLVVRNAPGNRIEVTAARIADSAAAAPTLTSSTAAVDKVSKDAKPAAPAGPRVEALAKAPPPSVSSPAAPTTAAVALSDSVVELRKSLAQLRETRPAAAADSASPRAAEAKDRPTNKVALLPMSTQATGAVVAGAAPAANAAERDAVRRREAVDGQPTSIVAMSADDRPIEAPGCYQIVRDSAGGLPRIPERFSLEFAEESGARRNVVRSVSSAGRRDTVIAGITWRLAPGSTRLVLINSEAPVPTMAFRSQATAPAGRAGGGFAGSVALGGATARISRLDCR